jgi:hypothetical protein
MEQAKFKLEGDITFRKHGANTQSMEAHKSTNKDRDCKRILDLLKSKGFKGATCEEISLELDMPYQTASGRCAELKHKLKLVIETGERRPTTSGSKAAVLALKVG